MNSLEHCLVTTSMTITEQSHCYPVSSNFDLNETKVLGGENEIN